MHRTLTIILLTIAEVASAATIRVLDGAQRPAQDVLVVVKSLDTGHEIGRYLTDTNGQIPSMSFDQGLYRIITTCPYGHCGTRITEMFAGQLRQGVTLQVTDKPLPLSTLASSVGNVRFVIKDDALATLPDVQVLVRTPDASREMWYKTDPKGSVVITPPNDPAVVAVMYKRTVVYFLLSTNCIVDHTEEIPSSICVAPHDGLELVMPK